MTKSASHDLCRNVNSRMLCKQINKQERQKFSSENNKKVENKKEV